MTVAELHSFAPGFDWTGYLKQMQLGDLKRIVVAEKTAFPKLAALYAKTPVETIKAWQAMHIVDNAAFYLSKAFADAYFEMHNRTLSGQQVEAVRWKRGVHAVSGGDYGVGDRADTFGNLGWAVGQLYTAKYFPPQSKAKIEELVANLKAAYHARIEKLDWMSPATKQEALKNSRDVHNQGGYPDHLRDYSSLVVRDDDLIGNVTRAAVADWSFYVARVNGPVDRLDWSMTPQTNDAYNIPAIRVQRIRDLERSADDAVARYETDIARVFTVVAAVTEEKDIGLAARWLVRTNERYPLRQTT